MEICMRKWIGIIVLLVQPIMASNLDTIIENISQYYVEDKQINQLKEEAISHLFSELDHYSTYLPKQQAKRMNDDLKGQFYGIGASLKLHMGELVVDHILPNSPANHSNLKLGDVITHINNNPVDTKSLYNNTALLKSNKRDYVTLTLKSKQKLKIQRDNINRNFIRYHDENNIGYFEIFLFNKKTPSELKELIEKSNHDAYVIDLRHNPGGLLYASLEAAGLFFNPDSDKLLTHIQKRDGTYDIYLDETKADITNGKPIYVVIGPYSASASELFASILQYYKRATILGSTSKGKGSIQSLIPLEDGSYMKLTTAYFTTPDGSSIDKHGIQPNISLTDSSYQSTMDFVSNHYNNAH